MKWDFELDALVFRHLGLKKQAEVFVDLLQFCY